jgi:hypothetical protein
MQPPGSFGGAPPLLLNLGKQKTIGGPVANTSVIKPKHDAVVHMYIIQNLIQSTFGDRKNSSARAANYRDLLLTILISSNN